MQRSLPGDPLSCTERAVIPQIDQVTNAKWSPSSSELAVSRFVVAPSTRTITGYREEQVITVLDLRSGGLRDLGPGRLPEWSGSGAYLSYWSPTGHLHINRSGTIAARLDASVPDVRWKGDDLYFWYEDEIRVWNSGVTRTIARVEPHFAPLYPRDDIYFSADALEFTITRYSMDGSAERFIGLTANGVVVGLDEPDVTLTEWSTRAHELLLRTDDRLVVFNDGKKDLLPITSGGGVHGWTADGRLLVGGVSPITLGGSVFDRIPVWNAGAEREVATALLPNLLGPRSFSPDGLWFSGVSRTGLHQTRLELYRCGITDPRGAVRAEPASRARAGSDGEAGGFVRPVAGAVTQFLQGYHTGVDIAAPFGSIIVAANEGTVTAVGWVPVGGRRVCVQHPAELESCYYHSSATLVSVGDRVARGQAIALIGMTGATTGPHLHWEVKQDGRIVDPLAH